MSLSIPGHGGRDPGAVTRNIHEAQVVYNVSQALAIKARAQGWKYLILRKRNQGLSLKKRVELINKYKAHAMVSLHTNHHKDKYIQGFEVYFQNLSDPEKNKSPRSLSFEQRKPFQTGTLNPTKVILNDLKDSSKIWQSSLLAKSVTKFLSKDLKKRRYPIKQAPFQLFESHTPSILVELGYLSNPKELKALSSKKHQRRIANLLFQGLKDYKAKVYEK